jgi:hypothetical protein
MITENYIRVGNTYATHKNLLLVVFLLQDNLFVKRLFAGRIIKNGLVPLGFFKEYAINWKMTKGLSFEDELCLYIEHLSSQRGEAENFAEWLFGRGYIFDSDVEEILELGGQQNEF